MQQQQQCRKSVNEWPIRRKNISSKKREGIVRNKRMICRCSSRRVQEVDKADGFNDLGKIKWELALCLIVVFIFVYFALWKGIKSSGKVIPTARMRTD